MIKNLSELLRALQTKEAQKLNAEKIRHPTIIGDMYEGLTKEVLERGIPRELDLNVVDGVAVCGDGHSTGQLDVMLVTGNRGRQIPHTGHYEWPIEDVLCVIEVKKTLFGKELKESFEQLRQVKKCFGRYFDSLSGSEIISPAIQAFEKITGRPAPQIEELDNRLVADQKLLHYLVLEQMAPLRIAFGYGGFKTEAGLRRSFLGYIESNLENPGFDPHSIPNLQSAGGFSLVKMNGQPYVAPTGDKAWPVICSSRENPLRFMIEMLWQKIGNRFKLMLPGEDLSQEQLVRFVAAEYKDMSGSQGWNYSYEDLPEKALRKAEGYDWSPITLSQTKAVIIQELGSAKGVFIDDPELRKFIKNNGEDPDTLFSELVADRIAVIDGNRIVGIGDEFHTMILPTGEFVGSNEPAMLKSWVEEKVSKTLGEKEGSSDENL